ncbi:flagellar hook-basal body complex protein [Candidatus Bodocaedibacter vickermanii]|uniref:Flagellar hook protein FlgE n=1 Tax=Candidatus Bodocaedibacter vickermanii TaxID=2741701 RepID=A0A7L9RRZ8_9PROT|nr:Flagellar hook protein FlgE [Candidatus Paracaedibacteraceae bacterium 'Lake Konstanz']
MKKLIKLIACLNIGASSIAMGSTLEVIDGGGYLVGVDRISQQEVRLVREGVFHYNPSTGEFENDEVRLLAWSEETTRKRDFSVELLTKQVCLPTTEFEFYGNLSSGSATPVGESFTKTQCIFDNLGTSHNLIFTFKRLPAGLNADNRIQYSTEVTVEGGVVKRNDMSGAVIDLSDVPMIVTFNQCGLLNLLDYGQSSESNVPPKLYIEWMNPSINAAPLAIDLKLGKGKGASPTAWTGASEPFANGNLTAYDGNSLIAYSQQYGGYAISKILSAKEPLRFSWIKQATGLSTHLSKIPHGTVRATSEIELSGNLSSGAATPVGESFTKTQRVFDSVGTPHNLIFAFTRLPEGTDSDNQVQYSTEVTVEGGVVKRNDTSGAVIDLLGVPMIVSFNQLGQLNLCDYGQATESNIAPELYIEWNDVSINSEPQTIKLNLGKGKRSSPTVWARASDSMAEGNLTAYDGNSLITYSHQDGLGYGQYESVTVSDVGKVTAHYSNRNSIDIGNLAVAIIPNPGGLKQMGASYRVTELSGLPTISFGGQPGWGKLKFIAPPIARMDAVDQPVKVLQCMDGELMALAEAAGND